LDQPSPHYASIPQRILAGLIDGAILAFPAFLLLGCVVIVYLNLAILIGGTYEKRIPNLWVESLLLGMGALIALGGFLGFFLLFRVHGATPGMRVVGLSQVDQLSGGVPRTSQALARAILGLVSLIGILISPIGFLAFSDTLIRAAFGSAVVIIAGGYIIGLFTTRRQTLVDVLCGTAIITEHRGSPAQQPPSTLAQP
jgi:uncharacterized RDD family membrane protein YckC